MANEERGEFAIELDGAPYGMRPSWEAIVAFEGAGGMMLTQMMLAASSGRLSLETCAVIVTECVKAWGKATSNTSARGFQLEAVKPLIMEAGLIKVHEALAPMLTLAVTGGLTSSGEVKPSATNQAKAPDVGASKVSPAVRSGGSRKSSGKARR